MILAVLVALLGAAAKRSQFEGPPHRGYLSKAVKMAGARANTDVGTEFSDQVGAPVSGPVPNLRQQFVHSTLSTAGFVFVPLLSPPLRV